MKATEKNELIKTMNNTDTLSFYIKENNENKLGIIINAYEVRWGT